MSNIGLTEFLRKRGPFRPGAAAALQDLLGARISMMCEGPSAFLGPAQAGSVKLLAVASPKRLPNFPDVPTIAETIPGFAAISEMGYKIVLYANAVMRMAMSAAERTLNVLRTEGNTLSLSGEMATWEQRQNNVNLNEWLAIDSAISVKRQFR